MFGSRKSKLNSMKTRIEELEAVIANMKTLPPKEEVEKRLAEEEFRNNCNEADICYLCGKKLVISEAATSTENLPEFDHSCPDHGKMWQERW